MGLFGLVATSRSPLTTLAVRMGIRAQRAPVGAGCVVTGVGVGVGPWAFVVRDLWVGGGGGWLSFQSLRGFRGVVNGGTLPSLTGLDSHPPSTLSPPLSMWV